MSHCVDAGSGICSGHISVAFPSFSLSQIFPALSYSDQVICSFQCYLISLQRKNGLQDLRYFCLCWFSLCVLWQMSAESPMGQQSWCLVGVWVPSVHVRRPQEMSIQWHSICPAGNCGIGELGRIHTIRNGSFKHVHLIVAVSSERLRGGCIIYGFSKVSARGAATGTR